MGQYQKFDGVPLEKTVCRSLHENISDRQEREFSDSAESGAPAG